MNLIVNGMHCKSCVILVKEALEELGASNIKIDLNEKKKLGKVSLEYKGNSKDIINIIEKEGYKIK